MVLSLKEQRKIAYIVCIAVDRSEDIVVVIIAMQTFTLMGFVGWFPYEAPLAFRIGVFVDRDSLWASNSALWRLDRLHLGQGPVLGVFWVLDQRGYDRDGSIYSSQESG
jgi:hypothetical protein